MSTAWMIWFVVFRFRAKTNKFLLALSVLTEAVIQEQLIDMLETSIWGKCSCLTKDKLVEHHDLFCSSKVIIKPDQLHSNNVADNFNWRQRTEGGALMFLEDNGKDKIQCVACNRFYKNRYELKRHITRNRCKPPATAKPLLFWSCFTLNKKTPHAQCLKITEKVEFNFASEASNVYIC